METLLMVVAAASICTAGLTVALAGMLTAIAEGKIAEQCQIASAQQPDEANSLRGTCFVSIALVETCAIYALVIAMILIFANPFWDYAKEQHLKTVEIQSSAPGY